MTVQYCQPYVRFSFRSRPHLTETQIRPIENIILGVDPRRLAEIDNRIVKMMGFAVHKPFIGYVDGLNPRKGAERMVEWLQKPLDKQPPTFAEWENNEHSDEKYEVRSNL